MFIDKYKCYLFCFNSGKTYLKIKHNIICESLLKKKLEIFGANSHKMRIILRIENKALFCPEPRDYVNDFEHAMSFVVYVCRCVCVYVCGFRKYND